MARGDHWWNEPPWWAWAVMAASLVAIIVMLPFALNREPPDSDSSVQPGSERSSAPATTSTTRSPSSESGAAQPSGDGETAEVLVIGDVDTAGFEETSVGWPAVLEERLPDVEMTVATTGDAGYVTTGTAADATFLELVEAADLTDVDVVVLFGSRFDAAGIADEVNLAVGTAIGAIAEQAPDAALVVIGPPWPGAAAPAGVRNNRDVIQNAAGVAAAVFVDPIADGWFTDVLALLGPDGEHLTEAADTYLADRIEPLVRQALRA